MQTVIGVLIQSWMKDMIKKGSFSMSYKYQSVFYKILFSLGISKYLIYLYDHF